MEFDPDLPHNLVLLTPDNPGVLLVPTFSVMVRAGILSDTARGMLSWDSEYTLITEKCRKRFHLPLTTGSVSNKMKRDLQGHGEGFLGVTKIRFSPHFTEDTTLRVTALVVEKITRSVPSAKEYPTIKPHLTNLNLADPSFDEPGEVELLTGGHVSPRLVKKGIRLIPSTTCYSMHMDLLDSSIWIPPLLKTGDRHVIGTGLHALETVLGWVVTGRLPPPEYVKETPQNFAEQFEKKSEVSKVICEP